LVKFITDALGEENLTGLGIEITSIISQHDPSVLRGAIINQVKSQSANNLFTRLINIFHSTNELITRWNVSSLIKALTKSPDPSSNSVQQLVQLNSPSNNKQLPEFLEWLYTYNNSQITQLLLPLTAFSADGQLSKAGDNLDLVNHCLDLLAFFVRNHGFRMKYWLLRTGVPKNFLTNFSKPSFAYPLYLQLSVLQALKAMLETNDDYYHRYFIKHNFFAPLILFLKNHHHEDDCITSAILDIFDYLRVKGVSSIIQHLFESFREEIKFLDEQQFSCFSAILAKSPPPTTSEPDTSNLDSDTHRVSTAKSGITGGDPLYRKFMQQQAEEDYFNEIQEDDDIAPVALDSVPDDLAQDSPSKKLKRSNEDLGDDKVSM
jgi:hypothetical protein